MTNQITQDGIQIDTISDILTIFQDGFRSIYGQSVTFEQDSPDGQMLNIFAVACRDILEFTRNIYNSFDPDEAMGRALDQRVLYNGLVRKCGTYTIIPVTITITNSCTLTGLDTATAKELAFTISDGIGNNFYLIQTQSFIPGTYIANFRASNVGDVEVSIGSVTTLKTFITGVKSVINETASILTGQSQESDAQLRLRRNRAVGYSIIGQLENLQATLLALDYVTDVVVYNNRTSSTDSLGVPSHSIWAIVEGGEDEKIASAIYLKLGGGCGMKGDVSVNVETVFGNNQIINFDRPTVEHLAVKITAEPKKSTSIMNNSDFISGVITNMPFTISSPASITDLDYACKLSNNNYAYKNLGVANKAYSTGYTQTGRIDDIVSNFHAISTGMLTIIVNDITYPTLTGLNFSSVASTSDIVSVLNTAITSANIPTTVSLVTDSYNYQYMKFTSNTVGYNSGVSFVASTGTGTDLLSENLINESELTSSFTIDAQYWDEFLPTLTVQHKFSLDINSVILNKLDFS